MLRPVRKWNIYSCNEAKLKRTDSVLGASRMVWEQSAETIVNRWLVGMGERQERTWGPDTVMFEPEFRGRLKLCQDRMDKLVRPVQIKEEVKVIEQNGERQYYSEPATVTMTADAAGRLRDPLDDRRHGAEGRSRRSTRSR